eukprot:TRINITY_DN6739_c0_g1_i2.p1 TRINITY_DN6739_c0_g1~~TRINITY_DN6739_c0_g1_i2.p1  ORF type:complete len:130 (-),score=3.32 TRINITY_DN6739_c0_g1_i2:267-656(-)
MVKVLLLKRRREPWRFSSCLFPTRGNNLQFAKRSVAKIPFVGLIMLLCTASFQIPILRFEASPVLLLASAWFTFLVSDGVRIGLSLLSLTLVGGFQSSFHPPNFKSPISSGWMGFTSTINLLLLVSYHA